MFVLLFILYLFLLVYSIYTKTMAGRGRPKKSTNVIEVNNIKLEYIVTKK